MKVVLAVILGFVLESCGYVKPGITNKECVLLDGKLMRLEQTLEFSYGFCSYGNQDAACKGSVCEVFSLSDCEGLFITSKETLSKSDNVTRIDCPETFLEGRE